VSASVGRGKESDVSFRGYLGHGDAMALVHVGRNGPTIPTGQVGTTGTHRDTSDTSWSDGKATNPA
jgi:hypothetical protein